jgi:lysyl-tRNA synthetase class 2
MSIAPHQHWRLRSQCLERIRSFFKSHNVIEVDTPLLYPHTVTDPCIDSFCVQHNGQAAFLQTSPEFAMKQLLAIDAVAIFQICKAFRLEESGPHHMPEFTMLEWYQPHWSMQQLIEQVGHLLQYVLACPAIATRTYADCMQEHANINPHQTNIRECLACLASHGVTLHTKDAHDQDDLLNMIMSEVVEPCFDSSHPIAVTHYPVSQAALACSDPNLPHTALRFEVFFAGQELANGYDELRDPEVMIKRARSDNQKRLRSGKPPIQLDPALLEAMHRMPPCSGVALGVDRLLMIAQNHAHIHQTQMLPPSGE